MARLYVLILCICVVAELAVAEPTSVLTVQGSTLVPLRYIAQWLGASVAFDADTRAISLAVGERRASLRLDSPEALVDGEPLRLSVAATERGGVTYVPLRFVAEALGAEVSWHQQAACATVRHPSTGEVLVLAADAPKKTAGPAWPRDLSAFIAEVSRACSRAAPRADGIEGARKLKQPLSKFAGKEVEWLITYQGVMDAGDPAAEGSARRTLCSIVDADGYVDFSESSGVESVWEGFPSVETSFGFRMVGGELRGVTGAYGRHVVVDVPRSDSKGLAWEKENMFILVEPAAGATAEWRALAAGSRVRCRARIERVFPVYLEPVVDYQHRLATPHYLLSSRSVGEAYLGMLYDSKGMRDIVLASYPAAFSDAKLPPYGALVLVKGARPVLPWSPGSGTR